MPWSPDQLSQRLAAVALMSRAHRDTAALTPCSVVLPVLPLLQRGRLDSCLAWLARRRLSDVRLASAGLRHDIAAALAAALARHAPALCLSSPLLVLVADQAGQAFDAGGRRLSMAKASVEEPGVYWNSDCSNRRAQGRRHGDVRCETDMIAGCAMPAG